MSKIIFLKHFASFQSSVNIFRHRRLCYFNEMKLIIDYIENYGKESIPSKYFILIVKFVIQLFVVPSY